MRIPESYHAVEWVDIDRLEFVTKPMPVVEAGKILLRIKAAGICGTDLHIISGKHPDAQPPLVPGHEFSGEIAAVGEGVDTSLLGKRVGADSYISCGRCRYCHEGRPQLCENGPCELGINLDGGWAEYVIVPAANIYSLPDNVSFSEAGAGCILNCPKAAIEKAAVGSDDTVVIIGDGPSSLIMVQLAKIKGAREIMITGHREKRLTLAEQLGATHIVNTHTEDVCQAVSRLSSAPSVVIDAVGKSETLESALQAAGKEARVHLFGLPASRLEALSMELFLFKELTLISSTGDPRLWESSMKLLSEGTLKVEPLISHRFPLSEPMEALNILRTRSSEVVKAIFTMESA